MEVLILKEQLLRCHPQKCGSVQEWGIYPREISKATHWWMNTWKDSKFLLLISSDQVPAGILSCIK